MNGKLKSNHNHFKELIDNLPSAGVIIDEKFCVLLVNAELKQLIGCDREDISGLNFLEIVSETDRVKTENNLLNILNSREKLRLNFNFFKKGFSDIPVFACGKKIILENGAVGIFMILEEIQNIKRNINDFSESDIKFLNYYANIPGAIYRYVLESDGKAHFTFVSDGIKDILGVSAEELMEDDSRLYELVDRDDLERISKTSKIAIDTFTAWHEEYRVHRKDGSTIWVEGRSTPVKGENNSIIWYGYIRDITKLKESVLKVIKLNEAIAQSSASIVITDLEGNIEYVNKAFLNITGYTIDEVMGQHTRILKSGEKTSDEYKNLWETITNGKPWTGEFHNKRKNGEYYWENAIISPIFDEQNKITGYVAVKDDITYRKQADDALRASEVKYRRIFESITDLYYQTDSEGVLTVISPSIRRISGWREDQILGKPIKNLYYNPDDREKLMELLMTKGSVNDQEIKLINSEGFPLDVSISARLLFDESGKYSGVSGIMRDISERKKIEREIEEQRAFLDSLLNSIPDLIFYKNIKGEYLGGNKAFFEFILKGLNDIVGKTDSEIFDNNRAGTYQQLDSKAITENAPVSFSEWTMDAEGNPIFLDTLKTPYWDKNGEILGILGISRNLTEVKLVQEALEESENFQKTLLENLTSGVVIADEETRLIENLNPAASTLLGEKTENLIGQMCCTFLCPGEDGICPANFKEPLSRFETKLRRSDGSTVWIFRSVKRIAIKGKSKILENFVDISEMKRLQEQLVSSEEKYRLLAENVTDVIWVFDTKTFKFTYISPSVFKLRGFTAEEAIQQNLDETLTSKSSVQVQSVFPERIAEFKATGKPKVYVDELEQLHKDGSIIPIEVSSTFIADEMGEVKSVIGVSRDITQRKMAEAQLNKYADELKELNATKDKFFSIIAHDLRNPFSVILGFIDLLKINYAKYSDAKREEILETLKTSANKAYRLLENLLTWSRAQTNKILFDPVVVNLSEIINICIEEVSSQAIKKNQSIVFSGNEKLDILADKNLLTVIVRNLLTNAIKYTHHGGKINVVIEEYNEEVKIIIEDSGIGISKDNIEKLFKIDSKISHPGTDGEPSSGLGLILCKEFIEKHNGKIWVESEIGKGSKFIFTLPN